MKKEKNSKIINIIVQIMEKNKIISKNKKNLKLKKKIQKKIL